MLQTNKLLYILLFLFINLFFGYSFVSADTDGFSFEYYRDQGLTEKIESGSKLKTGDYYIKINSTGISTLPVYISINSEGEINDVNNELTESIGNGIFSYQRSISYDPLAIGVDPELLLINGVVPVNTDDLYYIDTVSPELELEISSDNEFDIYRLLSNEALSYIKIEMSPSLYSILYKGIYKSGNNNYYGWHMISEKGNMRLTNIDIFNYSNKFTMFVDGSRIVVAKNDAEDDFSISVNGSIAEQIRNQDIVPLIVKDVAGNELETEFDLTEEPLREEEGSLILKDHIVGENGIYLEYELFDLDGNKIETEGAIEIKRKLKNSDNFEEVDNLIVSVEENRDFIYSILFEEVRYEAELLSNGVNSLEVIKTGELKLFQGQVYYEYSIEGFDLTGIKLYEFGETNKEYNIIAPNIYFEINKNGTFVYYFQQDNTWNKFIIEFEEEVFSAPTLKSHSFIEEEQSRRISFEMLSTGHDDITVNRATLNIFRTWQSFPI
ncbi:MAG: hypothetical protein PHV29_03845, partial [Candidatus Pacebacteria bacterium]|nr:hypothetical protein [Candidatus Paceibacterota bacterium]